MATTYEVLASDGRTLHAEQAAIGLRPIAHDRPGGEHLRG